MEEKRCGICTSVIEDYPCPLCGYDGELERPAARKAVSVPEEEIALEAPKKAAPVKKKPAKRRKKKKKKGSAAIKWLLGILIVLILGLAAFIVLTVHSWEDATCTAPQTCRICRKTQGEPLPHHWEGTCLTPGTCTVCGAVQQEVMGHSWERTDCLTPGVCSVCGAQEPEAPGHDWLDADCGNPRHCSRCGAASGSPLGHSWDGSSQNAQCSRCGAPLSEEQIAESQLTSESRRIFDSIFASRNWTTVYAAAGMEINPYESAAQYAACMEAYGDAVPVLQPISGSDGSAYEVLMENDRIAEFTLRRKDTAWELDALTLFIPNPITVTIQAKDGFAVSLNGVKLDESSLLSRTASPAAAYLPEGTPGLQDCTWQVTGLMAEPEVTVRDANGNTVPAARDDTGIYRAAGADSQITDAEKAAVFAALEGYSGFMINAGGARNTVTRYFENGTKTYQNILLMGSELWMNKDRGHKFKDETIHAFERYNDDIFAVRASIVMAATLANGSIRDYTVAETMFFRTNNGNLKCFAMTNQDLLTPRAPAVPQTDEWENCPDGIRIEEYSGPYFNAHIMLVRDPSRVYLGLSSYSGFSIRLAGKRLTAAIVDEGAVAAINAGAFYDDGTSDICVGSTPAGMTIYEGNLVSNVYVGLVPEKGFCGLDADGKLVVADTMTEARAKELGIQYGCEFGPVLIRDGKINEEAYNKPGYNPRTAVGQREDGTLIFVCADGRQAGSLGATYGELIDLLAQYGAVNACNMDGGSSTVMLTRDSDNNVSFVNSYSVLQSEPRRMPTFWLVRP